MFWVIFMRASLDSIFPMMHCAQAITITAAEGKSGEVLNKNYKFKCIIVVIKQYKLVTWFLISYSRVNAFVLRKINEKKKGDGTLSKYKLKDYSTADLI